MKMLCVDWLRAPDAGVYGKGGSWTGVHSYGDLQPRALASAVFLLLAARHDRCSGGGERRGRQSSASLGAGFLPSGTAAQRRPSDPLATKTALHVWSQEGSTDRCRGRGPRQYSVSQRGRPRAEWAETGAWSSTWPPSSVS